MKPRTTSARLRPLSRSIALLSLLLFVACAVAPSVPPGFDFAPSADPAGGEVPLTVSFSHGASVDLAPEAYTWLFGDGSGPVDGVSPVHTFDEPGTFEVMVRATDSEGTLHDGTLEVVVTASDAPAAFDFAPSADPAGGEVPLTVSFSHGASVDLAPEAYTWLFGDGSGPVDGVSPVHTFDEPGTFEVMVRATDSEGTLHDGTLEVVVTASDAPAAFDFAPSADPAGGEVPLTVSFSHGASVDLAPEAYTWLFGDGSGPVDGVSPVHTFDEPGTFEVMVRATDSEGTLHDGTLEVVVTAPPAEPGYDVDPTATPDEGALPAHGGLPSWREHRSRSGRVHLDVRRWERRRAGSLSAAHVRGSWYVRCHGFDR